MYIIKIILWRFSMKRNFLFFLSIVLLLVITGCGLEIFQTSDYVYLKDSKHEKVIVPSASVTDKESFEPPVIEMEPGDILDRENTETRKLLKAYLSDNRRMNCNGSYIKSLFYSTLDYDRVCGEVDGSSMGAWMGANPYNADKVTLGDSYSFSGLAISVKVPAGAGFSISGTSASWSDSITNNWLMFHQYSGIGYSGYGLHFRQDTSATFKFGYRFYTVNASDSSLL